MVYGHLKGLGTVLALVLLSAGCDLFDTRTPETPEGPQGTWSTPLESTDVLSNLSSALFERNTSNYMRSFYSDSFVFVADPQVLQQQPDMVGWDYAAEGQFIDQLFGEGVLPQDRSAFVVFSNIRPTGSTDTAEVTVDYELTAPISLAGAPGTMSGQAVFSMRIGDQGYWEIDRWIDSRTGELSSWSDLKALLSLR
ncbi:MAG: hypothetical protein IPG71_05280 [bacterium]|nr:hypothetical protein [bacterium]